MIHYQGSNLAVEGSIYSSFFSFIKSAFTGNAPSAYAESPSVKDTCLVTVFGMCLMR
jgi:hypothetical protein